ncbi:MAG TPA: envelope stress response membrane protein PspB [Stellaceae bacterium]|nr:envelope stress response membrane protein PspB [Stellaceae bacterium]
MMAGMALGVVILILGILFLVIILPIWIVAHYVTRWRAARGLSAADERMLAELWESARKLEQRIDGLERVFDAEAPGWRSRA